jgi:hypothetical protein
VRSARPSSHPGRYRRPLVRSAAVAACLVLIGAGAAGCETTQEKADKQQARATHILKARAERQKQKKEHRKAKKHHEEGKR